jgi:hypothetical protein
MPVRRFLSNLRPTDNGGRTVIVLALIPAIGIGAGLTIFKLHSSDRGLSLLAMASGILIWAVTISITLLVVRLIFDSGDDEYDGKH